MDKKKQKQGQIAVMLAMSFTLLFLLIAMVVNISFLVTAKINLQNAVDLAAYAGAAQQARYLTEIGKWNYEMRRNYKAMVFDYLIAYNTERREAGVDGFKNYIDNAGTTVLSPIVCASLQRQNNTAPTPSNEEKICQEIPYDQFENAISQANTAAGQAGQAMWDACSSGSSTCSIYTNQFYQMLQNSTKVYDSGTGYSGKYKNYEDKDYNYNRRLMAWALHAYRHLQTRIRGIHYGHIRIQDRLNLTTDKNYTTVFLNSPIGVAAKVINGYTDIGATDPTLNVQNNIIELESENAVKNPVHNAAYTTFKNNLLKVLSTSSVKIFHIVPNTPAAAGFNGRDMASGCAGATPTCNEYNGSYLRLQQHDVNFQLTYMTILNPKIGGGDIKIGMSPVSNFPVGVLKDDRVLTYYAVVGIADTKNIPFKVFYGDSNQSEAPPLIAVAAARPFGSRIGPYINDNCKDMSADNTKCEENGRDPFYPTIASFAYPNFSVVEKTRDTSRLGVKLSVDQKEYSLPTVGTMTTPADNPNKKVDLFAKTYGTNSRSRYYTRSGSNYNQDDGFTALPTETAFYENNSKLIPPQGNRNSVFAWNNTATPTTPSGSQDDKDSFEAYLSQYKGKAIHQFESDPSGSRKYKNSEYKVYVFRYPRSGPNGGSWDIDSLTLKTTSDYPNSMERAFANSMALSEFEIKRYIIPYASSISQDYLNYVADTNNKKAYVYAGETLRQNKPGFGNKPFADANGSNYAKMETDVLSNDFPDSYTSWRVGTRGYRVKLVNIQDLLSSVNTTIANPLPSKVTVTGSSQEVTIDLTKITY